MKLLLVVVIFAVVTYLAIRWMQDRGPGAAPAQRKPARPRPPSRPVAPDDDEAFLRELERRKRKQRQQEPPPPPDPDA